MHAGVRGLFLDHEIETQMARHAGLASRRELLREALQGDVERRVPRKGLILHEKVRRRACDKGLDDVVDNQGMRAVFLSPNILLQHPGSGFGDGETGEVLVRLTLGVPGQEGEIGSEGVCGGHGFQNKLRLGRRETLQDLMRVVLGRQLVCFRHGKAQIPRSWNENVLLMQAAGRRHIELNRHAAGAVDDFLRLRIFHRSEHTRTAHPQHHPLSVDDLQQRVDINRRSIFCRRLGQSVKRSQRTRESGGNGKAIRFEIGADDIVAGFVEGSRHGQAFGHVDSGDQDRFGPERGTRAYPLPGSIEGRARTTGIAEAEHGGGQREEDEREEEESDVLQDMEVSGRGTVEHDCVMQREWRGERRQRGSYRIELIIDGVGELKQHEIT